MKKKDLKKRNKRKPSLMKYEKFKKQKSENLF